MPRSGDLFERYLIKRLLGKGGLSLVYLVADKSTGRPFVLEVLAPTDPRVEATIDKLGRALARLDHPNLVRLHDVLDVRGHSALLVDHVVGETLADRLRGGRMSVAAVDAVLREIGEGLVHLHAHGIFHRDLKPSNVILELRGVDEHPRLADVGLAGAIVDALGMDAVRQGVVPGTPRYQSPEQLKGAPPDSRADVWALGALLYEMATGRPPFRGADPIALRHAALQRDYPPPRSLAPNLPERLVRAIDGALDPDPRSRIPDVAALIAVSRANQEWASPRIDDEPHVEPPPHELRAGAVLDGHLRLGALLGYDDLSETWRAVDQRDDRSVVIRALLRGTDRAARSRFEAATASLRGLNHASVPHFRPSFVVERSPPVFAVVRDWIPGRSLAEEATVRRFEIGEVLTTLIELLDVIGYLHAQDPPVVHRNLHPANVIRAEDGSLVVVDFGGPLAALADPAQQGYALVGAFGYMAPEQVGGAATLASDVYAAAAIAISLITRRHPSTLLDDQGRIAWAEHTTVESTIRALLDGMLVEDPEERPYAVEAAEACRALVEGDQESAESLAMSLPPLPDDEPTDRTLRVDLFPPIPKGPPPLIDPPTDPELHPEQVVQKVLASPPPTRPTRWLWGLVLGALGIGGLTAWLVLQGSGATP